ncbi:CAP domain-containing protein [Nocardioides donggukensis]|uniref:SCP domain-containing protein n=1 Tax=Nocardioides donggukensis TaxID=2774019 RepID=A0A927K2E6_9ACTN|nr:CAP domain-containing protein [Nocardioides donggukensis]MBD8868759.1 hypothetical protein [Nocardioides donggukensis]
MRTTIRLAVAAASALLVVVSGLGQPALAGPAQRYAKTAIHKTNVERTDRNLTRLRGGECLQRFARRQARRMARQERMFHQDLGPIMRRCGLRRAGENVAAGYPGGKAVVRGWMRSDGHRANILEPRFRVIGLAARKGDNGVWYAAQVFGRH